ncbi:hypothetical protein [Pseudodesulfovibrio sediminis]|uniref:Solute-binding protein family 3/N-terminal domain-containing protein n=1 Tax=Pseudodesulfovibrio sediminis TaxID=2810563 RepID=A0ABN6ESG0_9BACT|nr:hypothetical protein [Pseudodesulfovibrio sediminis]BCS88337.1 hypothetical protein PSDVSF_15790 [Pseudodesulfovibrio sediminis]
MVSKHLIMVIVLVLICTTTPAFPRDEILLPLGASPTDQRNIYPVRVLKKALDATLDTDGPYSITYASLRMTRNRALSELEEGKTLTVYPAATRAEWEANAIPVRIPFMKGLLGYRLLLVHRDRLPYLGNVKDIEHLKKFRAGGGTQWTTTAILNKAGFNVITSSHYDGLFGMLASHRFEIFPRGINEIYLELKENKKKYPELRVEPTLALYFPTPSYFFISPKHPELADRIRRGMEILLKTGVLDQLFEREFNTVIAQANLKSRRILTIPNPMLPKETPLDQPELWFIP